MDIRRQFALLTLLFALALAPAARAQNTENGLAELAQGRYAEALRLLTAAVEENPGDSRAVRGLAHHGFAGARARPKHPSLSSYESTEFVRSAGECGIPRFGGSPEEGHDFSFHG